MEGHATDVEGSRERCDCEAARRRFETEYCLRLALVDKDPTTYQIPRSTEVLSVFAESPDFALALATGGFRVSAELKLRPANMLNPFVPLASSNDAISREEIIRLAVHRAAEKYAMKTKFTYVATVYGTRTRPDSSAGNSLELRRASRRIANVKLARK